MGYIYYHKGIDTEGEWGERRRLEIFSKVPIMSDDYDDDDQYEFSELPNPDYGKSSDQNPRWNTSYQTIGWNCINSDQYITELRYDRDWNELMGVVEKISTLTFEVHICNWKTEIFSENYPYTDVHFAGVDKTGKTKMIDLCYQTIVEFIEWYNDCGK